MGFLSTVFLIADHVRADVGNRPCFGRVQGGRGKSWFVCRQTTVAKRTLVDLSIIWLPQFFGLYHLGNQMDDVLGLGTPINK
jgi:hypothetical protein